MSKSRTKSVQDSVKKGYGQKIKDAIAGLKGRGYDNVSIRVRQKWLPRWARICGVENYTDIDYSNPIVSLEWQLCDPRILKSLQDPDKCAEFVAGLTDDERELYYHGFWMPESEDESQTSEPIPYCELEKKRGKGQVMSGASGYLRDMRKNP